MVIENKRNSAERKIKNGNLVSDSNGKESKDNNGKRVNLSLESLYVYNLYNPQLVLLDCNVQLNPFGCYMISENAPRSTKGIWKKNVLKDWFGIDNDYLLKTSLLNGLDSQFNRLDINNANRSKRNVSKYVYSGIKNLGATCYMGSYLQYLFMNLDFRSKFLDLNNSLLCLNGLNFNASERGNNLCSGSKNHSNRCVYANKSMVNEGESSLSSMIISNIKPGNESFVNDSKLGEHSKSVGDCKNGDCDNQNFQVITELQKIFRQMETGKISVVNPLSFARALGISTENQEDATEFAVLLLSLLETKIQQLNNYLTESEYNIDTSAIFNFIPGLFRGTLNYSIECISCKSRTFIEDHFYELRLQILLDKTKDNKENGNSTSNSNIIERSHEETNYKFKNRNKRAALTGASRSSDIGKKSSASQSNPCNGNKSRGLNGTVGGWNGIIKLEQAFDNFFNQEVLAEDNQYMCDKCQCKRDAIKRCLISNLPPYLHVCLQRYCYDSASKARKKISIPVDFPQVLDLKGYCSVNEMSTEMTTNFRKDQESGDANNNSECYSPFEYEFIGILEHQGQSAMSGHYTASLRDFEYLDEHLVVNVNINNDDNPNSVDESCSKELQEQVFKIDKTEMSNSNVSSLPLSQNKGNFLIKSVKSPQNPAVTLNIDDFFDEKNNESNQKGKGVLEAFINDKDGVTSISEVNKKKRGRKPKGYANMSLDNKATVNTDTDNVMDASKRHRNENNALVTHNSVDASMSGASYSQASSSLSTHSNHEIYSNPHFVNFVNNCRLANIMFNRGNVGIKGSYNEDTVASTPTPLLPTPTSTSPFSSLTPLNTFDAVNSVGNGIIGSKLVQSHIQQAQNVYGSLVCINQNSIAQPQLIVSHPGLLNQSQEMFAGGGTKQFHRLNSEMADSQRIFNGSSQEKRQDKAQNIYNNVEWAAVVDNDKGGCSSHSEEDSSPTIVRSSQGSTVVIPQSQNSEPHNSHLSNFAHVLTRDNNSIFNFQTNTNGHVLGHREGHSVGGISQESMNYLQYLQHFNNQRGTTRGIAVRESLFGGTERGSGTSNVVNYDNYLNQVYNNLKNIDNNKIGFIWNNVPLINFHNFEEKGLKGGRSSYTENKTDGKNNSEHTRPIGFKMKKGESLQNSRKRWKWVHFDDTEVQEWVPKYSLNNNERMVTRTGYMLIYKRKDWIPSLTTNVKTQKKATKTTNGKKLNSENDGVQDKSECLTRNDDSIEGTLHKKLSLLNLRKQNITYLKNVILKPCIENWRERWLKRLELHNNNDEELIKNYLFKDFVAIPSDWWLSYVHGDDLEKILRYETGSYIDFWNYNDIYCRHYQNDNKSGFLDPFSFWEGKVKLFPPELVNGLEECIKKENELLKCYYEAFKNNGDYDIDKDINFKSMSGNNYMSLYDCICFKCVSSLYCILDISLKQPKIICEIMKSDILKENDVCLVSTRIMNSLITKFNLKGKISSSNIAFLKNKSLEVYLNNKQVDKNSDSVKTNSGNNTTDFDINWRSVFLDIKRDIQRNHDYVFKNFNSFKNRKVNTLGENVNENTNKGTNRTQDWSKEISIGSARCPHGSFIKSKINPKTAMLVPTELLNRFIKYEEERSKGISSFLLSNCADKGKDAIVSGIYQGYLRYKCTNKLIPCKHCNIGV